SSRRRHTRLVSGWSSDVCSSDLNDPEQQDECFPHIGMPSNRTKSPTPRSRPHGDMSPFPKVAERKPGITCEPPVGFMRSYAFWSMCVRLRALGVLRRGGHGDRIAILKYRKVR